MNRRAKPPVFRHLTPRLNAAEGKLQNQPVVSLDKNNVIVVPKGAENHVPFARDTGLARASSPKSPWGPGARRHSDRDLTHAVWAPRARGPRRRHPRLALSGLLIDTLDERSPRLTREHGMAKGRRQHSR